ncbi:hypothetical protein Rhopal_001672-T1 [Rhodotorula paludigena]|uniref:Uncharacterized protein n=1 Tax=Rhodotorula paludigena TaxID=86838 RepID=A0AAV5GGL1_9BASI|nr:hypothetical protein Rhopal_001672-T1 [Rhodotorula paludigena]
MAWFFAFLRVDLLRGVQPKPLRKDTRDVPLLEAVSHGSRSIEVAIHLVDGQILVGDDADTLTSERTLQNLYLEPLYLLYKLRNPDPPLVSGHFYPSNFLYEDDYAPFNLMLDYKTNATELHPHVIKALEPFEDFGLLEQYDESLSDAGDGNRDRRPLVVSCTGNCTIDLVEADRPIRRVFLDAPLLDIGDIWSGRYNRTNAHTASIRWTDLEGTWAYDKDKRHGPGTKLATFATFSLRAYQKSLITRVTGVPQWPLFVRNDIYRDLLLSKWPDSMMYLDTQDLDTVDEVAHSCRAQQHGSGSC